ncbi:MAG: hypothetical protein Q9174_003721 [Haloplaca sp. 1 TL-2023]
MPEPRSTLDSDLNKLTISSSQSARGPSRYATNQKTVEKDEDGFEKVSYRHEKKNHQSSNRYGPPSESFRDHSSNARPQITSSYARSVERPHLKQSCLPPGERDPVVERYEKSKGHVYDKDLYRPGMIIRVWLHEQDYAATSTGANLTVLAPRNDTKTRTNTDAGPVLSTQRKMIVLSMFEDHYLAVPLFTHNGNGLNFKTKPSEFVSVFDHRVKPKPSPLGPWRPLVTESLQEDVDRFSPVTTAHITYALPRRYNLPVVKEGHLAPKSTNYLIGLYNTYAPKKLLDPRTGKPYE